MVGDSDAHHWLQVGVRHTLLHADQVSAAAVVDAIKEGLTGFGVSAYTALRVKGAKTLKKVTKALRRFGLIRPDAAP